MGAKIINLFEFKIKLESAILVSLSFKSSRKLTFNASHRIPVILLNIVAGTFPPLVIPTI